MQNSRWLSAASSSRASPVHDDQQPFLASKEECHLKANKMLDDWESVLTGLSKTRQHDDTLKTAKLFTQVDSLSKSTIHSMEKTSKTLDRLLDTKRSILAAVRDFNDIQASLDVTAMTRKHWIIQEE